MLRYQLSERCIDTFYSVRHAFLNRSLRAKKGGPKGPSHGSISGALDPEQSRRTGEADAEDQEDGGGHTVDKAFEFGEVQNGHDTQLSVGMTSRGVEVFVI